MNFRSPAAWVTAIIIFFVAGGLSLYPLLSAKESVIVETNASDNEAMLGIIIADIIISFIFAAVAFLTVAIFSNRRGRGAHR